jgi:hypothetical protein
LPFDDGRRQCNCGVSCVREKQSREGARPRAPGERTGTQRCIFACSGQTCSAPVITDREDAIPPVIDRRRLLPAKNNRPDFRPRTSSQPPRICRLRQRLVHIVIPAEESRCSYSVRWS